MDAQNPTIGAVRHHLDQTIGTAEDVGPAQGREGEPGAHRVVAPLLRLRLRQAGAGHLRVGEDHRGDAGWLHHSSLAGDDPSHHGGLLARLVGEHRAQGHVADGIDMRRRRPAAGVGLDEAPGVRLHPGLGQGEVATVGQAARGHQHLIRRHGELLAAHLCPHHGLALHRLPARDPGARVHGDAQGLQAALDDAGQVGVHAGEQAVQILQHGHLGAQLGVRGAQFQADVAAAHHHQFAGNGLQAEGAGGVDNLVTVGAQAGQGRRPGARGDDAVLEFEGLGAVAVLHGDAVGGGEVGRPLHHRHLGVAEQAVNALAQLADDLVLPGHGPGQIDAVEARPDTQGPRRGHGVGGSGGADQRLGRDAAAVQADAAHRLRLDQGDLEAGLAEAGGGVVAAGAAADHQHLGPCDNIADNHGLDQLR